MSTAHYKRYCPSAYAACTLVPVLQNLDTFQKVITHDTTTNNNIKNVDITNTDNETTTTVMGPHVLGNKYVQNGLTNDVGGIQIFKVLLI